MKKLLISLFLSVGLIAHSATTYYVDIGDGSDSNDGLSPAAAWQSLSKVTNATYANGAGFGLGDTVLFRATNNAGEQNIWYGTLFIKTNGMTVGCYDCYWNAFFPHGSVVPIISGGATNRRVVDTFTSSNTTTRNLWIRDGGGGTGANWLSSFGKNKIDSCLVTSNAVDALTDAGNDADMIVINNYLDLAADDGMTLHSSAGLYATNNYIRRCFEGVSNSGSDMDTIISGCTFEDNNRDIGGLSLSTNTLIERCWFKGRTGADWTFIEIQEGNFICRYSIFDSTKAGPGNNASGTLVASLDSVFVNCLFVSAIAGDTAGRITVLDTARLLMTNCIFSGWWRAAFIFEPGEFISHNTIWSGVPSSNATATVGSITASPRFVNPGADWHLDRLSPALNAGANAGLTRDLEGNPVSNPPDVGAYEQVLRSVGYQGRVSFTGKGQAR